MHRGNDMAKCDDNGKRRKVTKSEWKKVFLVRSSQCIYRMVQDFFPDSFI